MLPQGFVKDGASLLDPPVVASPHDLVVDNQDRSDRNAFLGQSNQRWVNCRLQKDVHDPSLAQSGPTAAPRGHWSLAPERSMPEYGSMGIRHGGAE